jgi:hypothetical protein
MNQRYCKLVLLSLIFCTFFQTRPTLARHDSRRPAVVIACASVVLGLVGWAWWNDYIHFPGEDMAAEHAVGSQRQIVVTEEARLGGHQFSVQGSSYGDVTIAQDIWNWGTTLDLTAGGEKIAHGKVELGTWLTTITIEDGSGKKIGTIKREWAQTLATTTYSILDAGDNPIATSERYQGFVKHFELTDNNGAVVARVDGGYAGMLNEWTINIYNSESVDERLLLLLPAFQTAAKK